MVPRFRVFSSWWSGAQSWAEPRISATKAVFPALTLVFAGLAAAGCATERPWANSEAPPMRLETRDDQSRIILRPEDEAAIRDVGVELAGGADGWDGTPRLIEGSPPWSAVRDAVAAAGNREGIECVVARVVEDGSADSWDFELLTVEREPGRFRVERGGAATGASGFVIVRAELGRRPEASAMQLRTARLVAAFEEEMQLRGELPRFAEVGGGG